MRVERSKYLLMLASFFEVVGLPRRMNVTSSWIEICHEIDVVDKRVVLVNKMD
ncbi:hypothetical protein J2S05_003222 [Alkalicoccobacillus murimartini]|uniref:Uncharacterized protein n=1 Tax=Alkalicoccobacillus murimartini TaxID=171685 RepID=A0ABT9YLP3_9BACI|nr:hypothetical protein [Alkalicoccobacillus murimartini]